MARPEILTIKCYRMKYGDVIVPDVHISGESLEEAKRVSKERLLSYFHGNFRPGEHPHTASLLGDDGQIIAVFQVRPSQAGGEEVVELPNT